MFIYFFLLNKSGQGRNRFVVHPIMIVMTLIFTSFELFKQHTHFRIIWTTKLSLRPTFNPQSGLFVSKHRSRFNNAQLRLACDVASQRQSKQIGLEDFLFLLRKDKVKLCRLLRHFSLKDMRNRMSSEQQWTTSVDQPSSVFGETGALDAGCTLDFDEEELLNALISEQKTNQTQDAFYTTKQQTQQPDNPTTNKATIFPQPAKRLKLCLDFLASIDQTGELDRYLQEDQFFDELKHNRMLVSCVYFILPFF